MMIDENNAAIRARVASILHLNTDVRNLTDEAVREVIRWAERATSPRPIENAPIGDGWILGYVGTDERASDGREPWIVLTRADGGWVDSGGYLWKPTTWVALPDPQPAPSGWRAAEGHIEIAPGTGLNHSWSGWLVSVVKPDGSYDDLREPSMHETEDQAVTAAAVLAADIHLPIRHEQAPPVTNVVFLSKHRKQ